MKRLLKYTALIATVLMICSSAWAYNETNHINTAPNNKGDMMVFPWFLALDGGWNTKLTVINTDEVNSVVAKVVFRSFKNSEELLDFLIYLTPADVWTGKIYYNAISKTVRVFSDDDSILTSLVPTFATPANPVDQAFFPLQCTDDADYLGYVEVIESNYTGTLGGPGVKKTDLYAWYAASGTPTNTINVLAGYMELTNPVLGLTAGYRATTFRDYENRIKLNSVDESKIGVGCYNSMAEIEASFTKDDIAMPYVKGDNIALHFFTFPTKLTNFSVCTAVTTASPYYLDNMDSKACIPFTLKTYDLKENSPSTGSPFSGGSSTILKFCNEVNVMSAADFFAPEGWGHYNFGDITNDYMLSGTTTADEIRFYGAPVIATYLYIGDAGLSSEYGAWTDSYVYDAWAPGTFPANVLTDYQYTDEATENTSDMTKR